MTFPTPFDTVPTVVLTCVEDNGSGNTASGGQGIPVLLNLGIPSRCTVMLLVYLLSLHLPDYVSGLK